MGDKTDGKRDVNGNVKGGEQDLEENGINDQREERKITNEKKFPFKKYLARTL